MARLKAEFLHQYYRKGGLPWRNWIFGNVARMSRWGSKLAPVSNWFARSRLGRWLNEKLFGIDRRRRPPAFVGKTFFRHYFDLWSAGRIRLREKCVLLFPDTFLAYHEPQIGLAAVEVIQSLGYYPALGLPSEMAGPDVKDQLRRALGEVAVTPATADAVRESLRSRMAWGVVCCGRPMISNGLLNHASTSSACTRPQPPEYPS
jgi:Fe-S oxidoreductase